MSSNKNITATFTQNTYTLSVVASGSGSVSKNPDQPNYNSGTVVQLTATPIAGWTFTGWSGDAAGSTNPLSVTMSSNKNITATFTQNTYTLSVVASGSGSVSKNPDQPNYNSGTMVQLTATPIAGWTFTGWSGDATGSTNPLSVTMSSNKNITATFTQNTYTLSVVASGSGSVSKNPDQPNYNSGTMVQLTATPMAGWTFTGWSGDATGSTNPLSVTMSSNKNITATFTQNTYTLSVVASGSGSVSKNPDQPNYNSGAIVQITATPIAGWTFTGWSGDAAGSTNPLSVTMSSNKNITATFTQNTYTLSVVASGSGSVSKNPDQPNYNSGTVVQLTATPIAGWTFTGWSGDAAGSTNPLSVTMSSNKNITATFTQNTYTLSVVASGSGSVSKNPDQPNYNSGTVVQLTATPIAGWTFAGWSGDAAGSTNPLSVTMSSNKSITATFTQNTYTLSVVASGSGSVSKNPDQPNYNSGTVVELTATPIAGWTFAGWSGDATGSTNPLSVTMSSNKNITATFNQNTYTLSVVTAGSGSVSKNPDQPNYNSGSTVQLAATPVTGWNFTGWSGDATGSTNPLSVTMDNNKNITGTFIQNTYTLALSTSGSGSASKNPDQPNYNSGTTVQLTAMPVAGWKFTGWSGSATGSTNPLTVTMDGNKTVTATFAPTYTLSVIIAGSGSVAKNPDQPDYNSGDMVQLTATPTAGWTFTGWSGDATGSTNPLSVTMSSNKSITATFTQNTYTLSVVTAGSGSVAKTPDQPNYNSGTMVQLTATADPGWTFTGWSGDATGSTNPLSVTMSSNKSITATFTQITYTLSVVTAGSGSVAKNPDQPNYNSGTMVQLTATADPGWTFTGWSGDAAGSTNPLSVTMSSNKSITATFTQNTYTLSVVASGSGSVAKNPDQPNYNSGTMVQLTATADPGWTFTGWSGDAAGSTNPLSVTMSSNKSITATFTQNTYTLSVVASGSGSVSKNPDQPNYNSGTMVQLTATPTAGWTFTGWSGDAAGSTNPLSVTMSSNKSITATFTQNTYTLSVVASGSGSVAKNPDQPNYNSGTMVQLTATPTAGWTFTGWSGDAAGSTNPLSVTMSSNKNITATFTQNTYTLSVVASGSGSVSKNPDQPNYNSGTVVQLTATPIAGWTFTGWSGDAAGSTNPLSVTMDGNKSITATFTQNTYTLSVVTAGSGSVAKNPDQPNYNSGTMVQLTATPTAGWTFTGWSGDAAGSTNPLSVNMDGNKSITATFTQDTYTLSVVTAGSGSVAKNPDQANYNSGTVVQLTATPIAGWTFAGWSGDAAGSTNPLSVTMDGNKAITATFTQITYELTIQTDGTPGAVVNPSGMITVGQGVSQAISVSTTPSGYSFTNWTVIVGTASIANANSSSTSVTLSTGNAAVQANFTKFPVISDVNILNQPMKIGDVVDVIITIEDDGGVTYSLVSGSIGGYPLTNLQRLTSTTYTTTFTITAGGNSYTAAQSIPVSNLVLSDGSSQNAPFNKNITQNNDPIDSQAPVITLVWVESGNKKVGDAVSFIINTNGTGYSLDPSSMVNGIPVTESNFLFQEVGSGNYSLIYTVREGDTDVGLGALMATIVMKDQVGNLSLPVSTVGNSGNLSIDANSPVVQQMTVPGGDIGPGGVVNVTVHADGTGYTATSATTINGISLSSSRVSFTEVSGGVYTLSYTVAAGDNAVPRGSLQVRVYLRDVAGNNAGPFTDLDPNSLLIYTSLPTATISGTQSICQGDIASLTVTLTGRAPWTITLYNGSSGQEYTDINASPYYLTVNPLTTTTYTISQVKDAVGTTNTGSGSAKVTVNAKTNVEIINLATAYNVEDPPVLLQASVSGGTFSGPGVNSSTGYFDPGVADTTNSPHTIFYSYTNLSGCVSMDSAVVFVLGADGDIYIPKDVFCDLNSPFTVTAANGAGVNGGFTLLNGSGQEVNGLTDNGDNSAEVDPVALSTGTYTILYEYLDIIPLSIEKSFIIESAAQPSILSPDQAEFCQNELAVPLVTDISTAVFSGPGVSGNVGSGFIFTPASAVIGNNTITLTNTSVHGCVKTDSKVLRVNFAPDANFTVDKSCVSTGDTVFFNNTTENKDLVSGWSWNFDDPSSGNQNTSIMDSPAHIYASGGMRTITMIGETTGGCSDTLKKVVNFHQRPTGSFSWISECYNAGTPTLFISEMQSTEAISKYSWTFVDPNGGSIAENDMDSIYYSFNSINNYTVRLYTETSVGCGTTVERIIRLKPVITLSDQWPFDEDFNDDNGSWSIDQTDPLANNSWNYNTVNFDNSASNQTPAWFTDVPGIVTPEQSYVVSPCFDFRGIEKPMISLDIYHALSTDNEGVVLQAKTDTGRKWVNVGNLEDGINWFNSSAIENLVVGQSTGWTGNSIDGTNDGWIGARHELDAFAGKKNVQFRIFYGSNHTDNNSEGFAFDNFRLSTRSKKVLLEHFTNSADSKSRTVNSELNQIYNHFFKDVVKLEYHTEFPGVDPLNILNPAMPATRVFFYGVSSVPYSVLDGGTDNSLRFNYSTSSLSNKDIMLRSLLDPAFDISLDVTYGNNQLDAHVTLKALKNLPAEERIVHVVVYEKLITGLSTENGESNFLNVAREMLPNAAGTAVFSGWSKGQTMNYQFSWDYQAVTDPGMLRVATFIQSDLTKEVYQSESNDTTKITTAVNPVRFTGPEIRIYPNPASDLVNVQINTEYHEACIVDILDMSGRIVLSEVMNENENLRQLSLNAMNKGIYFVRIRSRKGVIWDVNKLVIMK